MHARRGLGLYGQAGLLQVAEEMLQDLKAEEAAQGGPPPYYYPPNASGGEPAPGAAVDRSQFDERNVRR